MLLIYNIFIFYLIPEAVTLSTKGGEFLICYLKQLVIVVYERGTTYNRQNSLNR